MICQTWANEASLAALMLLASCGTAAGQEFAGREKLRTHSNEFRKEVIRVTDGVYVAVSYSASNVTLIQGDGGSIIVDTASNPGEAREVRAAFGNLLDAPVRAIIYTHGHPDHTGGAVVFAGNDNPDVHSHQLLVNGAPDMSGGADQVLSRARDALATGEFQWAAELADFVLAVDSENVEAKRIKAQALTGLGEQQINATARNYYLSAAQYLLRDLPQQ